MALKATIYKAAIELADLDRNYYDSLALTIACHPSETSERMAARILAYCLNASPSLAFTRGLSTDDEPDIWAKNDYGGIEQWIEVGQPEPDRIRAAIPKSRQLQIYTFGRSADTWWKIHASAFRELPLEAVWQFNWADIQQFSQAIKRSNQATVTITEGLMYINWNGKDFSLQALKLQ